MEGFPGEQVDLYLIPTAEGSFESVYTIEGHESAGMHGRIAVTAS